MKISISGIYLITNLTDGKYYIGQSKDIYKRWQGHKKSLNDETLNHYPLALDMIKYGFENFAISILEIIYDLSKLKDREIYWIQKFNSTNEERGYNIEISTKDRYRIVNKDKTEKNKYLSEAMKQVWAERKAKGIPFTAGMVGKKHKQATKDQMRETHLKIIQDNRNGKAA